MNLVRRILEGIQEVELQITPEFRKPEFGPHEVVDALLASGWQEKGPPEFVTTGVELSTWVHPDIAGATVEVEIDTEKDVLAKDTITFKAEGLETLYQAKPWVVEKLTDVWKTRAAGRGAAPAGPVEYPVVGKTMVVEGLIDNRPWVWHEVDVISKEYPVVVRANSAYDVGSVKTELAASGLTYDHMEGGLMFMIFGSPGQTDDQVNKAFSTLLTKLDGVLGGPQP